MTTVLTVCAVYLSTLAIAYLVIKLFKLFETDRPKCPPCLSSLPLVGSLFVLPGIETMHTFFLKKSNELGNIIAFYMCDRYVIVLNGREAIHEALVKQSLAFSDRPEFYVNRFITKEHKGIVERSYNDEFKKLHRISLSILKEFGFGQGIMESRIKIEVDNLLKRFESKNGRAFDPRFEITASVSNVICSIIFGRTWDVDDEHFKEGDKIIQGLLRNSADEIMIDFFPIVRFLPRFRKALNTLTEVHNQWDIFVRKIINDIERDITRECFYKNFKKEIDKNSQNSTDSTSKTENQQRDYAELELLIRDLFTAGTETSATTLQWFVIIMANRQDLQEKLRDEMDRVIGQSRHPSLDDKQHLVILEATLLEIMRYRTLVPLALPHSTIKDTTVCGLFIPAGTMVIPNLYSAHFDPGVWQEPEKFSIERFLDETKTKIVNKDHVIPFSVGKRSCLGEILARQEVFLFSSCLVHEFKIYPPDGQEKLSEQEIVGVINSPLPYQARFVRRRSGS